jgi:hypothetical protein
MLCAKIIYLQSKQKINFPFEEESASGRSCLSSKMYLSLKEGLRNLHFSFNALLAKAVVLLPDHSKLNIPVKVKVVPVLN